MDEYDDYDGHNVDGDYPMPSRNRRYTYDNHHTTATLPGLGPDYPHGRIAVSTPLLPVPVNPTTSYLIYTPVYILDP